MEESGGKRFLDAGNAMEERYFVHPSSYVDEPCAVGDGTKIWHFCHIMSGCRIGENCNLGQNVVISPGVTLGRNVRVQNNVSVYTGVVCEDDVFLGPSCVFTNVINPRSFIDRKAEFRETRLCKGSSVGANATIVCGHRIGRYALIGAGAVVTRDVPDYALVTGVPGRVAGYVCECGQRLRFENGRAQCPECGKRFIQEENQTVKEQEQP